MSFINLKGKKFGRLTVGEFLYSKHGSTHWNVICDCGTSKTVSGRNMRAGKIVSCGCFHKEMVARIGRKHLLKHGQSGNPLYNTWKGMIKRCHSEGNKNFREYGARGITVCARWRKDFTAFLTDMGERPGGHSLDRIDVNKGYSAENCRWLPTKIQATNRQNSILIKYRGETVGLAALARKRNANPKIVSLRLKRGWGIEDALSAPLGSKNPKTVTQVLSS